MVSHAFEKKKFEKVGLKLLDKSQDKYVVLEKMEKLSKMDQRNVNTESRNKITGCTYLLDEEVQYVAAEANKMFLYSNLLHPDVYTAARWLESQLIQIACQMFYGKPESCGITTTGGTESIILAVYSYQQFALKVRNISRPELLIFNQNRPLFGPRSFRQSLSNVQHQDCENTFKRRLPS